MPLLPDELVGDLLTRYGFDELERARGLIGSSTLREALELIVDAQAGEADLFIPHYWAVYYHDGRGGFAAPAGHKLVFFADSADDPRLSGGYPVRSTDIVRLTRDQFEEGLRINGERRAAGLGPFMFVVDSVGPAVGSPFFDRLAEGAGSRMDPIAEESVDDWVQSLVDELPELRPERRTASFRL